MQVDSVSQIDTHFIRSVKKGLLPEALTSCTCDDARLSHEVLRDLFTAQLTCRHIDFQARLLQSQGKGFYTIASAGHEGNVVVGELAKLTDPAFLHYRSGALMLQRAKKTGGNQVRDQLLSLMASKDDPTSCGRHKVFGSLALNTPPQTSTIASHLPKAVGTAFGISLGKQLCHVSVHPYAFVHGADNPVVLCSFGDASVNHSTAQGAFHLASWIVKHHSALPIVFICEDNGLGVSVVTPDSWIKECMSSRYGLEYIPVAGLDLAESYRGTQDALHIAREQGKPVFLHMKMVRLMGHAGSDVESVYLRPEHIATQMHHDPLLHSARLLQDEGVLSAQDILCLYEQCRDLVQAQVDALGGVTRLDSADEIMQSIIPHADHPLTSSKSQADIISRRTQAFADLPLDRPRHLCQQLNYALRDILCEHDDVVLFGEDVGRKGGVYHVTAGLQQHFGAHRIFDTLLDEQSIFGTAMGLAYNGFLPIAEIQFLAYLHNAEDQLRGEAATLSFFSDSQFANPLIIRIPSFAYQKGFGGHFHNDNSIAVLRDIPGLIIACPSNGQDGAAMLRECVRLAKQDGRIVIFLEPIALYMQKDLHQVGDNDWASVYTHNPESIPLGQWYEHGAPSDTLIISYANGYYLSRQAAKQAKKPVSCIDLRWLSPIDFKALSQRVARAKHVIIVDECRHTGALSDTLIAHLCTHLNPAPRISCITAKDSFIPLGPSAQYVLPSVSQIVAAIDDET